MLGFSEQDLCVPGANCELDFAAFTASTWEFVGSHSRLQEIMVA